jgi:hypothetical protein
LRTITTPTIAELETELRRATRRAHYAPWSLDRLRQTRVAQQRLAEAQKISEV